MPGSPSADGVSWRATSASKRAERSVVCFGEHATQLLCETREALQATRQHIEWVDYEYEGASTRLRSS